MPRSVSIFTLLAFAWATGLPRLDAAPPETPETAAELGTGRAELVPMPTLGGKQFWGDELLFQQWRIQRNATNGQCRLIDPNDLRHASGTLDECRNKLDEIKRLRQLPPMDGRAVIVLHGLNRSRRSMEKLCAHLREKGGYTVFNVTYPSTRRSVDDHAQSLGRIVENLDGIDEINLVGHSLGNIVIRRWLFDQLDPATGRLRDARVKRLVMLGPPNHGSSIAAAFGENRAFGAVEGESARELGVGWAALESKLATGPIEFGIIAGGRGDGEGFNPALPGDDDGVVTVATARLDGAADFLIVPVLHSFLMKDDKVIEQTLRFLQTGRFAAGEAK
jgi:pimeloyl-ACP methyl ester carboxylesterase